MWQPARRLGLRTGLFAMIKASLEATQNWLKDGTQHTGRHVDRASLDCRYHQLRDAFHALHPYQAPVRSMKLESCRPGSHCSSSGSWGERLTAPWFYLDRREDLWVQRCGADEFLGQEPCPGYPLLPGTLMAKIRPDGVHFTEFQVCGKGVSPVSAGWRMPSIFSVPVFGLEESPASDWQRHQDESQADDFQCARASSKHDDSFHAKRIGAWPWSRGPEDPT